MSVKIYCTIKRISVILSKLLDINEILISTTYNLDRQKGIYDTIRKNQIESDASIYTYQVIDYVKLVIYSVFGINLFMLFLAHVFL